MSIGFEKLHAFLQVKLRADYSDPEFRRAIFPRQLQLAEAYPHCGGGGGVRLDEFLGLNNTSHRTKSPVSSACKWHLLRYS